MAEVDPQGGRPPRPVTPVGIAALELSEVLTALGDGGGIPASVMAQLRRAHRLVAGLDRYAAGCTTPESPGLRNLADMTASVDWGGRQSEVFLEQEMLSGHLEGQFLATLVRATGARQVLEIGMFTGYSALAMAEALPADGRLIACEIDQGVADLARQAFADTAVGERIEVRVGPAADTLDHLASEGAKFDFVFIDADKGGYLGYLEQVLAGDLLAHGGLVAVDNTFLQGQPWAADEPEGAGRAIADFNAAVGADPRLVQVLVPIRDGVTLITRAPGS